MSGRRSAASLPLSRTELGDELAFGFQAVGAGVTGETNAVAALGDEIGAGADHLVGRLGSGDCRDGIHARFGSPRASGGFLAHQLFGGWSAFLWLRIQG